MQSPVESPGSLAFNALDRFIHTKNAALSNKRTFCAWLIFQNDVTFCLDPSPRTPHPAPRTWGAAEVPGPLRPRGL